MKIANLKKVSLLLILSLTLETLAFAAPTSIRGLLNDQSEQSTSVSEFVFRNDIGETLVPIYLLGAVSKPGLYHIPLNTDLVSLITLAGGPNSDARLDEVMVRRKNMERAEVVNVEKMVEMRNLGVQPLKEGDVVVVNNFFRIKNGAPVKVDKVINEGK